MKTKRPLTFPSRVIDIWQCAKSREHAYPRPRWPLLFFFAALSVRHHDGALLGQRGGRLGQRQKIRGGEGFNVFGTDAVHTFTRSHPLAAMLLLAGQYRVDGAVSFWRGNVVLAG